MTHLIEEQDEVDTEGQNEGDVFQVVEVASEE